MSHLMPSKNAVSCLILVAATTVAIAGCGKKDGTAGSAVPPVVTKSQVTQTVLRDSVAPGKTQVPSVAVTAVLDKSAIFNQEFLYGADLQYSSFYDSGMDLYNQSLALGHVPATFRVAGDELQLVTDNRRLFPSGVNHPEQVITRFRILSQDDTTLTVAGGRSDVFLAEVFENTKTGKEGALSDPAGKPPRDQWIRSFEYAKADSLILQETSIVLDDGVIAEFMESIMPRKALAPGADFEKFQMDPEDPVGASEGPAARFRFLKGEKNFNGEEKLAFAEHFDISPKADGTLGTIDWYVTPNIKDDELRYVGQAIEGWNRYFKNFKGINRDVVRFRGRLPEGIKLGDPRFNVVNWDDRLIAGAAYESQAVDPSTGKQSHSLIYMPAAWFKIGADYWTNGRFSDSADVSVSSKALDAKGGAFRSARVACMRDLRSAMLLPVTGRLTLQDSKEFGARLLKQTLFHEVGHALGLAHNFKGSLSFDRSKPGSPFSTSIMDYNDFEIERGAFPEVESANGPQLEYDRQALSAIYNRAQDISEQDAVVPACNDEEADNEDGGVDPLCIRYDIENDPTHSVVTALDRINQQDLAGDVTLAQSIARVPSVVLSDDVLAKVTTEDQFKEIQGRYAAAVNGSVNFYVLTGKASFSRTVRTNVKSLYVFADGVLPENADERGMRDRAFTGVQKALGLRALPSVVLAAVNASGVEAVQRLMQTPYAKGLDSGAQTKLGSSIVSGVGKLMDVFTSKDGIGLSKLRGQVLGTLARHPDVSFFFGDLAGTSLDIETAVISLLRDTVVDQTRTPSERVAAASSLASYRNRLNGNPALVGALKAIADERTAAKSNLTRDVADSILDALAKR